MPTPSIRTTSSASIAGRRASAWRAASARRRSSPSTGRRSGPSAAAATVLAAVLATAAAGGAFASSFQAILLDGDMSDWDPVPVLHTDPTGDQGNAPVDLGRLFVANDDRFVYLRFDIGALLNLQRLPAPLRVHLDTDASTATGYPVEGIGADILVECSRGGFGVDVFEQTASSFYATDLGHGVFDAYQAPTVAGTEFELRLRRDTDLPQHGTPAFPAGQFGIALVALNTAGQPAETAPNAAGTVSYVMATGTPPPPPDNDLARLDPGHVRLLTYNTHNGALFGSQAARFTRLLQAIGPDVIAFQELWDHSAAEVATRLDQDLPLAGGAEWQAEEGNRGQITASRYPLTLDGSSPFGELTTLVDLPDQDYDHDLYVIDSHFKCCGAIGTSEDDQRQAAADAIVAWIRDLKAPGAPELAENTPIVHLGDLNLVGGPQPLVTLLTGDIIDEGTYGPDSPPDWDDSDLDRAAPIHTDGLAAYTWRNDFSSFMPGKLDYIIYTDAVATAGNRFVVNTLDMSPAKLAALGLQWDDTREASDHLPAVLDLEIGGGSIGVEGHGPVPVSAVRLSATPNPFAGSTELRFELPAAASDVRLVIFDGAGRFVRDIVAGARAAGPHRIAWDGRDADGRAVGAGVYFARLEAGDGSRRTRSPTLKIAVLR